VGGLTRAKPGGCTSYQKRRFFTMTFFQDPAEFDLDLLLGRAKEHVRRKEWTRAIGCLDVILREPPDHPVGKEFLPDKEVGRGGN
jgi:hypothetical protein